MATNNAANTSSGAITLELAASDLQTTYVGANTWATGLDDDAGDAYKISANAALGTNDTFIMSTAGERTMPLQPSFFAYNSVADADETGNSTVYTVICDTEIFDQNSDYNNGTGIFTAPIMGRFYFCVAARFDDLGAAHTLGQIRINTSNRLYITGNISSAARTATNQLSFTMGIFADMDAADTAQFDVLWGNGTKTVDISGGATVVTYFMGYLVC